MVRLKDIAQLTGVSVMTVSKALRDEPDVSAATKAKIKKLAQEMAYVPDSSAQGLRTKTTKLFGLLIPATTNPVYARMVMAVEERAHELGYDILFAHSLNKPEREEQCLRRFLSHRPLHCRSPPSSPDSARGGLLRRITSTFRGASAQLPICARLSC